jgi:hypothetical protein
MKLLSIVISILAASVCTMVVNAVISCHFIALAATALRSFGRSYGSGMGYSQQDYLRSNNLIRFGPVEDVFEQDYVLVLRCPPDRQIRLIRPGACLISMLHFPTRPQRVEQLHSLGLEAISLDSIKDDTGRRLVENLQAVAWNGIEAAFDLLAKLYPFPGFESPARSPIHVTAGCRSSWYSGCAGSHVTVTLLCIAAWQKRVFWSAGDCARL